MNEELKTLKDLKPYIRGHDKIHFTLEQRKWIRKELMRIRKEDKAEAIKWYKYYKDCHFPDEILLEFIEKFNNLTEDDLK